MNTRSYEKKYKKLVNKLYDWTHAIHEINVLINKNYNGINNNKIADLIKDLSRGNKQLAETIESGKLKDETLMKISLCVTSDIDMTIQRWTKNKNGIFPNPFISSFFQNDSNMNKNNYQDNNNYNFNCNNNNQNNNVDLMNFYNVNNGTKYINKNNYGNNNNNNNNNGNSFNLLIDFNCDSAPAPLQNNQNMFNINKSTNTNDKNFNNFMDFVNKTEQNQNYNNILSKSNINFNNNFNNNLNNNFNSINVSQSYNLMNKMNFNNMNNNNTKYNEYNSNMENNNDNITSRQSLMYPSFDELNDD